MRSHALAALLFTFFSCASLSACDTPVDPDGGVEADSGEMFDGGMDAGPRPPDVCDELSLARAPMAMSTGIDFGDVAGDFTVNTLDGSYHYAEARSGCESYVFLNYIQDLRSTPTGTWFGDTIWSGNGIDGFLLEGPRNVQYFYTSYEPDPAARATRMEAMRVILEEKLAFRFPDPEEQAFWRARFHFVTDRVSEISGSVGEHFTDYFAYTRSAASLVDLGERGMASSPLPFFFGIDRHQRFHAGDDLNPFVGGTPSLMMAAYVGHYYNHLFEVDEHLAGDGATVVALLDAERTTERVFNREVTLPDAATMAGFDTLEIEVAIGCDARNPFACSEWDRIADVQLCLDETCTDRLEIGRWITPYWRRGPQHWTIDASPFLPLLAAGGATRFFVETGPDWERATEYVGTVALRFSDSGDDGPVPAGAVRVFTGGVFDATYNEREPVSVAIPADATRVELVTILSGHGQVDGSNCAEWCDHRHLFTVNGTALPPITYAGSVGSGLGCADRVGEGVPPNQLGNWAPERAYWCPGLPVDARHDDLTALVTPGEDLSIDYEGRFRATVPSGGDIALSAYVVWYR
jgi:hypothetical protein